MQIFQTLLVGLSVATIAVAFVLLVRGILRQVARIAQTLDEVSRFLRTAEQDLSAAARDIRVAAQGISKLASTSTSAAERIDSVAKSIQRLVDGAEIAAVAAKTLRSSTAGITSVYEGVKQGIRTLCGFRETEKGGTSNE
ncbi:MAG: DUF948 domain-containing protein [Armatimonadota bacterium]